jgi:hypothetical protein
MSIERNAVSYWRKLPEVSVPDAFDELQLKTQLLQGQRDYRERRSLARRISFLLSRLADKADNLGLSQVQTALTYFRFVRLHGGKTDLTNKSFGLIRKRLLDLRGEGRAPVLQSAKAKTIVNSGLLAIYPDTLAMADLPGLDDMDLVKVINAGGGLIASLGADGRFLVEIRLLPGPELYLADDEYRLFEDCTEEAVINVFSGDIKFGSLEDSESCAKLQVSGGSYLASIHQLVSRRSTKFVALVCPTITCAEPFAYLPTFNA